MKRIDQNEKESFNLRGNFGFDKAFRVKVGLKLILVRPWLVFSSLTSNKLTVFLPSSS